MAPQHRHPDKAHPEGGKPFTALALQAFFGSGPCYLQFYKDSSIYVNSPAAAILFSTGAAPLFGLTLVLLRVLDIRLLRKLKVRLTLYFSDSTLDGMMYLSHSSSSILFQCEHLSQVTLLSRPCTPSGLWKTAAFRPKITTIKWRRNRSLLFIILIMIAVVDAGMKECPDSLPRPPLDRPLLFSTCLACLEVTMNLRGFYL